MKDASISTDSKKKISPACILKIGGLVEKITDSKLDQAVKKAMISELIQFRSDGGYSEEKIPDFLEKMIAKYKMSMDQLGEILGSFWCRYFLGLSQLDPKTKEKARPFLESRRWLPNMLASITSQNGSQGRIIEKIESGGLLDVKSAKKFLHLLDPKFPKWGIDAKKVLLNVSAFAKRKKLPESERSALSAYIEDAFGRPLGFLETAEAVTKLMEDFKIGNETGVLLGCSESGLKKFKIITRLAPSAREEARKFLPKRIGLVLSIANLPVSMHEKIMKDADSVRWEKRLVGKIIKKKLEVLKKMTKSARDALRQANAENLMEWARCLGMELECFYETVKITEDISPDKKTEMKNLLFRR